MVVSPLDRAAAMPVAPAPGEATGAVVVGAAPAVVGAALVVVVVAEAVVVVAEAVVAAAEAAVAAEVEAVDDTAGPVFGTTRLRSSSLLFDDLRIRRR